MLDRMVGKRDDKHCDDIMRLSVNTKGTYWYVSERYYEYNLLYVGSKSA